MFAEEAVACGSVSVSVASCYPPHLFHSARAYQISRLFPAYSSSSSNHLHPHLGRRPPYPHRHVFACSKTGWIPFLWWTPRVSPIFVDVLGSRREPPRTTLTPLVPDIICTAVFRHLSRRHVDGLCAALPFAGGGEIVRRPLCLFKLPKDPSELSRLLIVENRLILYTLILYLRAKQRAIRLRSTNTWVRFG